jgi:hypothetical protein
MAPACFHLHLLKAEEAAENRGGEVSLKTITTRISRSSQLWHNTPLDCIAPRTIDQLEMYFFQ